MLHVTLHRHKLRIEAAHVLNDVHHLGQQIAGVHVVTGDSDGVVAQQIGAGQRILPTANRHRDLLVPVEPGHMTIAAVPAIDAAVPRPPITWPATLLGAVWVPVVLVVLP